MADNKLLQQMLESLVNDDQAKAEELFHEYVVSASREIYESMIDSEIAEEEEKDEEKDEEMDEASEDEDAEEDKVEENFGQFEGGEEGPDFGGDAGDDLEGELNAGDEESEFGDEEAEKGEEELFQDLEAIVDELQAKFDELKGIEGDEHGGDFGDEEGEEMPEEEGFDLATVREYVEKVPGGHGAEKKGAGEGALVGTGNKGQGSNTNTQSLKFNKNDMGGTTANIVAGGTEKSPVEANKGQLKGSSLIKQTPTEDNAGNINVPGGNAGKTSFKKKEPGHGAEKKGQGEGQFSGVGGSAGSTSTQSLFRGRR